MGSGRFFAALLGSTLVLGAIVGCGGSTSEPARVSVEADAHPTSSSAGEIVAASSASVADAPTSEPVSSAATAASAPAPPAAPPLPKGTVVLHVGDSFVHSGLTQELRKKFEPLGVKYEVRAEKSTNSLDWAKRLPEIVSATQPDLVIVTLGGNEIGSKYLDVEAHAVERIVKAIGDRPCVWTTPPLWMEESGVFDAIQTHVAPCRFFETDVIVGSFLPRRDGIHPTMEGGATWGDALFGWLERERVGAASPWELRPAPADERATKGRRGPLPH